MPLARSLAVQYRHAREPLDDLMPGREPRAGQGRRPLRPRSRDRVHLLRRADDPRRAQAPLPRPHVDDPRLAQRAGVDRARRDGQRGPAPGARALPERRRGRRGRRDERRGGDRGAAGRGRFAARQPRRADAARGATAGSPTRSGRDDDGLDRVEDARLDRAARRRRSPTRQREVLRLRFVEDLVQREIAERVGLSPDARVADPPRHARAASRRGVARAARCRRRARRAADEQPVGDRRRVARWRAPAVVARARRGRRRSGAGATRPARR